MKIQSLILCDDLREEVGSKYTLVGIYDHTIQIGVPKGTEIPWPIGMNIGFMARGLLEEDERNCNSIEVQFLHNGVVTAKLSVTLTVVDPTKPISLKAKLPDFPISGPGVLSFKFTLREGNRVIRDVKPEYSVEVTVQSE